MGTLSAAVKSIKGEVEDGEAESLMMIGRGPKREMMQEGSEALFSDMVFVLKIVANRRTQER
jgi:hypothetical protein